AYTDNAGWFRLNDLADGNVRLTFTYGGTSYVFNAGADKNISTTWDNRRITLSSNYQYFNGTNTSPGTVFVYNSSGTVVSTGTLSYNLTSETQGTIPVNVYTYKNGSLAPNVKTLLFTHNASDGAINSKSQITASDSRGIATFMAEPGLIYHTACSENTYFPTIKDQLVSNPQTLSSGVSVSCPITSGGEMNNSIALNISGFSKYPCSYTNNGCTFFTTVYRTSKPDNIVAMDLHRMPAPSQVMAFNLPTSAASELSTQVLLLEENRAVTKPITFALPSSTALDFDFTNALPPGTDALTLSSASIAGVVKSGGVAVSNAKVSLNKSGDSYENAVYRYTDGNGAFIYNGLDTNAQYNLYISSLGFAAANRSINALPWSETLEMEAATYSLEGYVKYNGIPISGAEVSIWGDWNSWNGSDAYACTSGSFCSTGMSSNANAVTNGAGYFRVNGLPDGNVSIYANLRMLSMNYNAGADGNLSSVTDNRRVTIVDDYTQFASTYVPAGATIVYDGSGVALSSGPVVINWVETSTVATAKIAGTLTFNTPEIISASNKLVISTSSPVTLMASQNCGGACSNNAALKMGLTSVSGSFSSNEVPYEITVPTGYSYYLMLPSSEWAIKTSFDRDADFTTGAASTTINLTLTKSGALRGQLKNSDGSLFMPKWGVENSTSAYWFEAKVEGVNIDYDDGTGLREDGTYNFANISPGTYNVTLMP
ncbi:MAG TPA: carboxypeptidase-like regulatory domain-containing protein, partial [Elusimicrobiales bacterium]|nr:carboxypeptidase-like regulatory domain-containing protein [Elusimicrobiales bacterium]